MPIDLKYTDNAHGFMMIGRGIVTTREIFHAIDERFSSEEQTRKYIYGLDDLTDAEKVVISVNDIHIIRKKNLQFSSFNPNLILAIVAPHDLEFGMGRMFEAITEESGWSIRIFRSSEKARSWIKEKAHRQYGYNLTMC